MSKLIIAIPSKGRIMDDTYAFFGGAGMKIRRDGGARNYTGTLRGVRDVEVRFLSASEIATSLGAGAVHFGVTGLDLLKEKNVNSNKVLEPLLALGFGRADVVVAAPQAWIDVDTMADLGDVAGAMRAKHHRPLRVATKYFELTRSFFADKGVVDYRIVESLGATEGAPAAGSAEVIVDITSTGATLLANNLKVLDDGVILESQAYLTASLSAKWSAANRETARVLLDRVAARQLARDLVEVRCQGTKLTKPVLQKIVKSVGGQVPYEAGAEQVVLVPEDKVYEAVTQLRAKGCKTVTARKLDYVFEKDNALINRLEKRLG